MHQIDKCMPMTIVNLPVDLLRTLTTVVDLGGFTRAGDALGRTQPAISLQIRRLEELVGVKLIAMSGKTPKLTPEGEILSLYARQILSLNDEAVGNFRRKRDSRVVRVGLPTDYSTAFLQGILTDFARQNPATLLEIRCELSTRLLDDLRAGELDVVVAMTGERVSEFLARAWLERPIWVASRDSDAHAQSPVPLVSHGEGCEYRRRMTEALQAEHRAWRIAYSSPGISGVQNAVIQGLGVSAMTERTLAPEMRILDESHGFPALTNIRVGLYYEHHRLTHDGLKLVNQLVARLDSAHEPDFRRLRALR